MPELVFNWFYLYVCSVGGLDTSCPRTNVPFHISFSVAEIVIYMQGLLETAPCKVV